MSLPENPTVFDVVAAAQNMGMWSLQRQSISNFLLIYEGYFTVSQFNEFIAVCYNIMENIIEDCVTESFPGKTPGSLTETERKQLWNSKSGIIPQDARDYIAQVHSEICARYGITATRSPYEDGLDLWSWKIYANDIQGVLGVANDLLGLYSHNIQSLSNFILLNEDEFTSYDYEEFIMVMRTIAENIIEPYVAETFGKAPINLINEEREQLWGTDSGLPHDARRAILNTHISMCNRHRILMSQDYDADGYPVFYWSVRH